MQQQLDQKSPVVPPMLWRAFVAANFAHVNGPLPGNCDIWSVTNYLVYFISNQYE
jgi:hypothetical protein